MELNAMHWCPVCYAEKPCSIHQGEPWGFSIPSPAAAPKESGTQGTTSPWGGDRLITCSPQPDLEILEEKYRAVREA